MELRPSVTVAVLLLLSLCRGLRVYDLDISYDDHEILTVLNLLARRKNMYIVRK